MPLTLPPNIDPQSLVGQRARGGTIDPERDSIMSEVMPPSYIDIVFDGPPGPECGRFIEAEYPAGVSISAGEWIDRGDGIWALRITQLPEPKRDMNRITKCWQNSGWHVDRAGPCFGTHAQAIAYRDRTEKEQLHDFVAEYGYVPDYLRHAL